MKSRSLISITTCAFLIPLALLSINAASLSFRINLSEIDWLMMNWLLMSAPHLVAVLIAMMLPAARLRFSSQTSPARDSCAEISYQQWSLPQ